MGEIKLAVVRKSFAGGVTAVDDVTLTIADGEFVVLVGPSGCGKTTLLRMIAGLEKVDSGSIRIDDREVAGLPPMERDIAMVFQNYALYPHMTVAKNLGYGLRARRVPRAEIKRRVTEVARMLGLDELLDRRPTALSGGQRQRVAMGRALIREPVALLMDEPLSNLDAKLRVEMRAELSRRHETLGVTTVYVTHDQVEAMTLGQRVAVMRQGRIQQIDTPQALYTTPSSLFVAAFIGSPSMNLVDAEVIGDEVVFAGFRVPLDRDRCSVLPSRARVILGIRPEAFEDAGFAEPGLPQIEISVEIREDLGPDVHIMFRVDAPRINTADVRDATEEDTGSGGLQDSFFTARVNPRTRARIGGPLMLSVDPSVFHFFDAQTGRNLMSSN